MVLVSPLVCSHTHTQSKAARTHIMSCNRYHTRPTLSICLHISTPCCTSSHLKTHLSPPAFSVGLPLTEQASKLTASRPDQPCLSPPLPWLDPVRERAIQGLGLIIPTTLIPIRGSTRGVELNLTESGPRPATGGHWAAISSDRESRTRPFIHPLIQSNPIRSDPIQSAFCIGTTPAACLPRLLASAAFPPPPARVLCSAAAAACCCSTCPHCPSFASVVWTLALFSPCAWGAECHRRQGACIPVLFVSFLTQDPLHITGPGQTRIEKPPICPSFGSP